MIDIREGREFIGIWFAETPGGDLLACAWRERGSAAWVFDYRFRYYVDDKVHDSADTKSGYRAIFNESVEKLMASVEKLFGSLRLKPDFCDLRGVADVGEMVARLGKRPWAHFKATAPGGEA